MPRLEGGRDFTPPVSSSRSLLGWLKEQVQEGERLNKADPGLAQMESIISYVMGEQHTTRVPKYVRRVVLNQMKRAIKTHVSALTDVEPLFGFKSRNPKFQDHAGIINNYIAIWWVNTFADLELASVIRYALVGGVGDLFMGWDPTINSGDTYCRARDPRDTLPFRPEGHSIQEWEGVTLRERHSINKLLAEFPDRAYAIKPDSGKLGGPVGRFRTLTNTNAGERTTTLDGLKGGNPLRGGTAQADQGVPTVTVYRSWLNDRSLNFSVKPVLMGTPGTSFSYVVQPGQPLYPYKRLINWTEHGTLYDGPSPFWHGLYPIPRLVIEPWPWLFTGASPLRDLQPLQDAINYTVNDLLTLMSQTINRGSIWDKQVPEGLMKRHDPREPNWKVRRPTQFSDGMKQAEVPVAPGFATELLSLLFSKFEEHAGTAGIQAFLSLRQAPGADTVQKYIDALTPDMRVEGRQIEAFVRDMGTIAKSNLFQFQSGARRFTLLGDAGKVLEDLDWDPDTMIPAMKEGEEGYVPELDAALPRAERARFFMNLFSLYAAPNSMLAMHAQDRKMLMLQLSRQGYVDIWTLAEVLEIENMGTPPPIQLPKLGKDGHVDPGQAPPLEWRIPRTIGERLIAQQELGLGQAANPAGRKASGQQPPQLKGRPDGSTTITESR